MRLPKEWNLFHTRIDALYLVLLLQEERRFRGDLIQFYKFESGKEDVNRRFQPERGVTQRFHRELIKNGNDRFFWFCNRIVNQWNCLPPSVITADTTNTFKNRFDALGDLRVLNFQRPRLGVRA